jgi:hypothetical protein
MPDWYVSYAWGDDRNPEGRAREQIVDQLCNAAADRGYCILRDKDVLSLGDSISSFMRRIGTGDRVFVILSDKYLHSPHCMFELSEIWRTSRQEGNAFLDRVRIYALPDAKIFKVTDCVDWAIYWKHEHDELERRALQHGIVVLGELGHRKLMQLRNFYTQVSDILGTLADIVQPRTFEELQQYGLDDGPIAHLDVNARLALAEDFDTPPERLAKLAGDSDISVTTKGVAPSVVEVAHMRFWGLLNHYNRNRCTYISRSKAIVASVRALKAAQPGTGGASEAFNISVIDLAIILENWLSNDPEWNKYLHGKVHMQMTTYYKVTALMSRYIAWDAYVEIMRDSAAAS